MASARATTKVIVVGGGGTMGSSTALHLIRSGYAPGNITVLDVYPFPSAQSAGNDLNKIMGIRVSSEAELRLSREAEGMWKNDDLFKPFFHKTGRVSRGTLCPLFVSVQANPRLSGLSDGLRGIREGRSWPPPRI